MSVWLAALLAAGAGQPHREIPVPLPGHPGNIFLAGENVVVPIPATLGWVLQDYDGRALGSPRIVNGAAQLGNLPVGFYRLVRPAEPKAEWVSIGVINRLKQATSFTSPICIDAAMAWFYKDPLQIKNASNLCALAGVNRVRDRLAWGEIETARRVFPQNTRYDASLHIQAAAGLQTLTVNHQSPAWATTDTEHFPPDLRDIYGFYKMVSARWKATAGAIEPWNESDIEGFGGQTGTEMAALQKAGYLGLKDGNPGITACLNVWAQHIRSKLQDFNENHAWAYFDTYNLHHYEDFEAYPGLYADHRAISAGKPLWVTECAVPVRWSGDPLRKELSDLDLKLQAERLAKVYACSIMQRASAVYYFILGDYVEGQTQFGIIRKDLTPRPAYVALAAAGRLLADAVPAGSMQVPKGVHANLFSTRMDGQSRVVAMIWADKADSIEPIALPAEPLAMYDVIGRQLPKSRTILPQASPIYAVLPADTPAQLVPPPAPAKVLEARAGRVVLQPLWPRSRTALAQSSCRISLAAPSEFSVYAYNFGKSSVSGTVKATIEGGWKVAGGGAITLTPMDRQKITLRITPGEPAAAGFVRLHVSGDFGPGEQPVASVRFTPESSDLAERTGTPAGSLQPADWELMVANGPQPTAEREGETITFSAAPTGDPWFYPKVKLPSMGAIPAGAIGLACSITVLEGDAGFKFIFDEANNASYVSDAVIPPTPGKTVKTIGLFAEAVHGDGWSAPDPKGEIDPTQIVAFKIGCNGKKQGTIRFKVGDIRWIIVKKAGK